MEIKGVSFRWEPDRHAPAPSGDLRAWIRALLRDPEYELYHRFWSNVLEGLSRFERDHRLFEASADWHARTLFR